MQVAQTLPQEAAFSGNGLTSAHDLFALTDEQILEIEPEVQDAEISGSQPTADGKAAPRVEPASLPAGSAANAQQGASSDPNRETSQASPSAESTAPPEWLAQRMKDPWSGEETREFWQGIQQGRQEAAAYREVFAKPEEARAAAERARVLDDIDRAYFGTTGKSAAESSASRAQLAAMMMREDPAAFREMVFAGLRALERAGDQANIRSGAPAVVGATLGSPAASVAEASAGGARPTPTNGRGSATQDAHVAAYAAFEKAANEDLERSVGAAIERTLEQTLQSTGRAGGGPLKGRLATTIRQDVEAALKGDRQLGEQVAQILSGRRLDNETRAQVVRLIGERAQQLVPTAAKRVLNDWTQTTFAAHRAQSTRADATSARREVAAASSPAGSLGNARRQTNPDASRDATKSQAVDYRKLSDEQILEL